MGRERERESLINIRTLSSSSSSHALLTQAEWFLLNVLNQCPQFRSMDGLECILCRTGSGWGIMAHLQTEQVGIWCSAYCGHGLHCI